MRSNGRLLTIAFLLGLLGWLAVGALHLTGELVFFAAILIGAISGAVTRRPVAIGGLVVGMLAAYPLSLALGVIVFLGENWLLYAVISGTLAVVGFIVSLLMGAGPRSRAANARSVTPSRDIPRR